MRRGLGMSDSARVCLLLASCAVIAWALAALTTQTLASGQARRADAFDRARALAAADIEQARAQRVLWLGTDPLLARAGRAFRQGAFDNALLFAARARREARLALNQARLEAARYFLELNRAALPPAAAAQLAARVQAHDGIGAGALARRLGADISR